MADFRKLFLVLAVGALFATAASAVDYHCDASSVPTLVRAEGIAEMMGDVKLDCSGTLPNPAAGLVVNIRLTLSTNVTSNLLQDSDSTTHGTGAKKSNVVTEATLVLDRGTAGFRGYCGSEVYNTSGTGNALTPCSNGSQNVYQAIKISDTEIEWQGVVLAGPGSAATSQVLLTNVRGNASAVGSGAPIMATINITTPTSLTINSNNPVVANTRTGLAFSVTAANLKSCVTYKAAPDKNVVPDKIATYLKFTEGFNNAFRPQYNNYAGYSGTPWNYHDVPAGAYADESGFNPTDFGYGSLASGYLIGLEEIGLADQGTELMARIAGVPAGVSLAVPLYIVTTSGLVLELQADQSGTFINTTMPSAYPSDASQQSFFYDGWGDVTLDGSGNGSLVYEVVAYDYDTTPAPSMVDTVYVPVAIAYTKGIPAGSATVNGTFSPLSTVFVMSAAAPEPRFIDSATDSTLLNISLCRSILLFPDITSQSGFDTGIAISNTSADPILTTAQAGACKLNYYGNTNQSTGPAVQTTPSIPAGGQLLMLLSTGGSVIANGGATTVCASGNCVAPGFQGYMIALCDFQYAHGFAFITDMGAQKVAMGYLALIIPDNQGGTSKDTRKPDPNSDSTGATGENLGQ